MQISMAELAENLDKYVNLAQNEDIWISRDGQDVARLTSADTPKMKALKNFMKLKGILPADTDVDAIREERILK